MCVCIIVGCQKKEVINSENISGESDEKVSGESDLKDASGILSGDETNIDNNEKNVLKDNEHIFSNDVTKENVVSYEELMDKWDRKAIIEINFIDINMQEFDKEYDQKAYVSFNNKDTVIAYLANISGKNIIYFVSDGSIKLLSGNSMFKNFENCEQINGIELLDTSDVIDMAGMFYNCRKLKSLNLSSFDTRNVIQMGSMFFLCNDLMNINLNSFDTSNVKYTEYMFGSCSSLTNLDVSRFNTSNVVNMNGMFNWCKRLTNLDVRNFDTSNVTNMWYMFNGCSNLTNLDVSGFNTSNVVNMNDMFASCSSLTNLDVRNFDTSKVISMNGMFDSCSSLINLNVSNFNTSRVENMGYMFKNCSSLTNLDVRNFDTSHVRGMNNMFASCSSLTYLDLSNFDTSKVTDMSEMFLECRNLKDLDLSNFNTTNVTKINDMFKECTNLKVLQYYYLSEEIISSYDLNDLTGYELELVKCEIYARNGCEIDDKVLAQYFMSKDWYKPISGKKIVFSELSKIEQINIELIDEKIKNPSKRFEYYYYDEEQEKLVYMNVFSEPIKILKEISILDMTRKYDTDWDTQKNEYPLAQKYLLKDNYENKKFGVNKLEIYFCGFKYDNYIDPVFEININGVKKEVVTDEDIYVIDFDENDGYLEIATEDWWESGCSINIYRFIDNKFVDIGSIPNSDAGIDKYKCRDGKVYLYEFNFPEKLIIPKYYVLENNKLVLKVMKYDEVEGETYTITEDIINENYFQTSVDNEAKEEKIQVGDKIKILKYNDDGTITGSGYGLMMDAINESGYRFMFGKYHSCMN